MIQTRLLSGLAILIVFLAIILSAIVKPALAGETQNYIIHQHYIAPRAMGMGNTFSGIDDYNLIFYNPAGLTFLTEGDFNFGVAAATSTDTLDFVDGVQNIAGNNSLSDPQKIQEAEDYLTSKYKKIFAARLPKVGFVYARPKWSIAFVPIDLSVSFAPHQLGGPALDVTAYQDTTLAFGWAKKRGDKKLAWGFVAKAIYRGNVDKSILAADLISDSDIVRDEDFKEGMTVDADVGVKYSPFLNKERGFFKYANPTFDAVLRNVVDYGFTSNFEIYNDRSTEPEKLHRRLDVGSKWKLKKTSSKTDTAIMIDLRDMLHDYASLTKILHLGAEMKYNFGRFLNGSVQAGINQGYWTAGLGLQSTFIKLELTSFAEEYGTKSEKKTNRQTMAQFNLNF